MELKQNSTDNSQEIVNRNEKFFSIQKNNYLYPNGHRMTHQMRWLKGISDRNLKSDIAA